MKYQNHKPRSRLDARGNLVLLDPYRYAPRIPEMSIADLRYAAFHCGGYTAWCAEDELDRRSPRTASWCSDVKKGWQPVVEVAY
jgi:hypothetical protein